MQQWIAVCRSEYMQDRIKAGETVGVAKAAAERSYAELFPKGMPATGHHVFDVRDIGAAVGYVWIGPQSDGTPQEWWIWDIAIDPDHRGKGFGRETMLLAEQEVKRLGGSILGLNVFGFNTAARALYESLGYEPTSIRMSKTLSS